MHMFNRTAQHRRTQEIRCDVSVQIKFAMPGFLTGVAPFWNPQEHVD